MHERDIFLAAIEIAHPDERVAYLDQACAGNAELRAQVEELLRTHAETSQFLETPAAASNSGSEHTVITNSTDDEGDSHERSSSGEAEFRKYLQPSTRPGWLGRLAHYEIEEILGRGAFGIVAKAFDEKLHRVVAIKLMSPDLATTSPPRKRFLREARTAAAVTHENIVAIHAVEEEPIPYLVMEFIPGQTLQQRMEEHGPLDLAEVLRIGQQVASGLAAAHAANLIHRDIKPANILLTGGIKEKAKISDFGLARAVDDATMTSSGVIAGTPMYMAPEQARGEPLDHRADLFSLGSVLYQMVCGRPPFRAANTVAVLKRVCEDTPRPLDDVIPETPDWLQAIIFRLLEKQRDDRYQTAQEVADLLARCQSELEHNGKVTCVPVGAHVPDCTTQGSTEQTQVFRQVATEKGRREPARHRGVAYGVMITLVAVAFALVVSPRIARWFDTPIPSLPPVPPAEKTAGLEFDGKDDWVEVTGLGWNYPQFTIEAFVTSAPNSDNGTIAYLGGGYEDDKEWMSLFEGGPADSGKRISGAAVQGKTGYENAYGPFRGGERQHRALTYNGRHVDYYINGIWQGQRRAEPHEGGQWKLRELRIGCDGSGRKFFQGVIDQLRISRVARYSQNFAVTTEFKSDDQTLALYRFDEGQGEVLKDHSGNGHDGKIIGARWVNPVTSDEQSSASLALRFDGVDDYVELPTLTFDNTRPFTMEIWAHVENPEASPQLIQLSGVPNRRAKIAFSVLPQLGTPQLLGSAYGDLESGTEDQVPYHNVRSEDTNLPAGAYHAALCWEPTGHITFFINGRRINSPEVVGLAARPIGAPSLIGANLIWTTKEFNQFLKGHVWRARVSRTVRYQGDFTPTDDWIPDAETLALYRFDEGQGDVLKDHSGNGHNGKIVGAEWQPWSQLLATQLASGHIENPLPISPQVLTPSQRSAILWLLSNGGLASYYSEDGKYQVLTKDSPLPTGPVRWANCSFERFKLSEADYDHFKSLPDFHGALGIYRSPHIRDAELTKLVNLQCLNGIREVALYDVSVSDEAISQLRKFSLEWVKLGAITTISDKSIATLIDLPLLRLDIGECPNITGAALQSVGRISTLEYLRFAGKSARLSVTDADVAQLANLRHLKTLDLFGTSLTDDSLEHLSRLQNLQELRVEQTQVTETGVRKLSAALPACRIFWAGGVVRSQTPAAGWHGWPADAPKPAIAPFDAEQAKKHQEAWAAYLKVPVEYTNSIGMKFRLIPPGEFLMVSTPEEIEAALKVAGENEAWRELVSSEAPQHKVILTQPVYVGVTEVTQTQYEQVMGTNPSHFSATGEGKDLVANLVTSNHPVEMVSWNDAAEFCAKLCQQEKLNPFYFRTGDTITPLDGNGYRLPTDAEWEFTCRAGTTTRFWSGDTDQDLNQVSWFSSNSGGRTHAAGELKANPFGLWDAHGNVWEWVQDSWDPVFHGKPWENAAVDPSIPFVGDSQRVIRGGNWLDSLSYCRSSYRYAYPPANRHFHVGFRVSLSVAAVREAIQKSASKSPSSPTVETSGWHGWPADAPKPAIAPFDAEQAKQHQEAWAKYLKVPVEYTNTIGMKFRLVPPGEFTMGSTPEEIAAALQDVDPNDLHWQACIQSSAPQHKVIMTQPIYLAATEVTQSQYENIMGNNPSFFSATGPGKEAVANLETGNCPVEMVSWIDAAEFCAKLSQKETLMPFYLRSGAQVTSLDGTGYRLPTEAEWEYACRAGTMTRFWSGQDDRDLMMSDWVASNSGGRSHAVGELEANPFGLYDVHGNVWERVEDCWAPDFYKQFEEQPAINPTAPCADSTNPQRVIKGGRFFAAPASVCLSALRFATVQRHLREDLGFRVALTVDAVRQLLKSPVTRPAP